MLVVDVNVLLYATNPSAERHAAAHGWLARALNEPASVGFTWLVLLGFLRIATHPSIFEHPLGAEDALRIAATWTVAPGAAILEPSVRHLAVLSGLLRSTGTGGNLTNDAHLAAIAIEHGAGVCSYDNDFDRFDGLRRVAPE